jgi:serine/threonine protein kinase
MGTVFLVVHKSTNTPYAMKVMKKETLISKKAIVRAMTERNILTSLQQQQHPFLPSLFTSFETEKHSFLVMDYCTGGDLNVLRQRQSEKIFSVSTARYVSILSLGFSAALSAFFLHHAHV